MHVHRRNLAILGFLKEETSPFLFQSWIYKSMYMMVSNWVLHYVSSAVPSFGEFLISVFFCWRRCLISRMQRYTKAHIRVNSRHLWIPDRLESKEANEYRKFMKRIRIHRFVCLHEACEMYVYFYRELVSTSLWPEYEIKYEATTITIGRTATKALSMNKHVWSPTSSKPLSLAV